MYACIYLLSLYAHTRTHTHTNKSYCYRIAINSGGVIQFDLGINDVSHKKKLGLRAMDVVLFGLPKGTFMHQKHCK